MKYFDNAASTKVFKSAADAAYFAMLNCYANPSSLHNLGLKSNSIINSCRKTIAKTLNEDEDNFIFTSGATESINLAILGAAQKFSKLKKNKIVTSNIEHKATSNCLKKLQYENFKIVEITPKNKEFYAEDFADAVDDDCFLVSVMHVNNENGLILPVEEIAKKVKEKNKNILVHVDAAQSFLKIPLNLSNIDLCSVSAHKINAPKGIGALYINKHTKIKPLMFGGGQEKRIRPGTQATALICAFEVAVKENFLNMEKNFKHYTNLKKALIDQLKNVHNLNFNFTEKCVPYIVNISLKGVKSQVLMQFLEEKGFLVSAGAACSKNFKNETILNLKYDKTIADSAIRISFGVFNNKLEVIELAKAIAAAEKTLIKLF